VSLVLLHSIRDGLFWAFCAIALLLVIAPAVAITVGIFAASLPLFGPALLLQTTNKFGLQNALLGSALIGCGVLLLGGPLGVGAGMFLSEYAPRRRGSLLRFLAEVLAGVPSIIVGYVGYTVLIVGFHWGYSLLAGVCALSVLVIPYIARSTETSLHQVPTTLREAALALGLPRPITLWRVIIPPALPGIITGLLVALAIATSETAPLLYTVGFSDANPTLQLTQNPLGYLTYVVYVDAQLPDEASHQLANAAAAASLLVVLMLVVLGRLVGARSRALSTRMNV